MKGLLAGLLLTAASFGVVGTRLSDGANSRVESDRGARAYFSGDHKEAVDAYRRMARLRPGSIASFDLGTALVAAGDRAHGESELEKALRDPALAPMAHYNRGNASLDESSFDEAIREYTEALRLNPRDLRFKRNLEIALRRKSQQHEQSQSQNAGQDGESEDDEQQTGGGKDRNSDEMASILRSVEQQEREELRRMRRARVVRRPVGW